MQNKIVQERAVDTEALVVKPAKACVMLDCGHTRFYKLISSGELESYRDGASRKVTIASIRGYIARRIAEAHGDGSPANKPHGSAKVPIR